MLRLMFSFLIFVFWIAIAIVWLAIGWRAMRALEEISASIRAFRADPTKAQNFTPEQDNSETRLQD